jgi:hypothetical protein
MSLRDKAIATLNMADPAFNENQNERAVALAAAHKMMDKGKFSFASLGFTERDAERIEGQPIPAQPPAHTAPWSSPWSSPHPVYKGVHQRPADTSTGGNANAYQDKGTAPQGTDYNPYKSHYKSASDCQGPVPGWDGWDGN